MIADVCSADFKSWWTLPSHITSEWEHAVSLLCKSCGNYLEVISNVIFEFVLLKWIVLVTPPTNQQQTCKVDREKPQSPQPYTKIEEYKMGN